ncbi:MAG: phage terminase large subunit [Niabella sp.]|nr:phage terminase large subunit [Niabella sp.]
MEIKLNKKQTRAFDLLNDKKTTTVFYGGSVASGKSWLGCSWLIYSCLTYPGTKYVMGRAVLKTLKETTLQTFLKVAHSMDLKQDKHFTLTSAQDLINPNCIVFSNGSVILLKDLAQVPSDPDYNSLGSLEITGGWIDECAEVPRKAADILMTRMRHKLSENGLIPKLFISSNPTKSWLYYDLWLPYKAGQLSDDKAFIQALPGDNEFIDPAYLAQLHKLEGIDRQRLLLGNWDYSTSEDALISYEAIENIFKASHLPEGDGYISCDVARFGKDRTVICLWSGFRAKIFSYQKQSLEETADQIRHLMNKYNVPPSRVIIDSDGLGAGPVDSLNAVGFVNNGRPQNDENYKNAKSQVYYQLAEKINKFELFIDADVSIQQRIREELEQVRQADMDKDVKKAIISKDKVKEVLGRSPDYSDALAMRMYFDFIPEAWAQIIF